MNTMKFYEIYKEIDHSISLHFFNLAMTLLKPLSVSSNISWTSSWFLSKSSLAYIAS